MWVQVIRSVGQWSAGASQTEESIHNAYISLIEKAEHFIYIEVWNTVLKFLLEVQIDFFYIELCRAREFSFGSVSTGCMLHNCGHDALYIYLGVLK